LKSNTKRYELSYQYYTDIREWHANTARTLIKLKELYDSQQIDFVRKRELLGELSSQIEIGRFYFPNIDKGDKHGLDKPMAYRGYRNAVSDFNY
jgi:hypothetical protein